MMRFLLVALLLGSGNGQGMSGGNGPSRNRGSTAAPAVPFTNTVSTLFDGDNDFVTVGKPANMDFNVASSTFTLAAWVKRGEVGDFERHFFGKAFMSTVDVTAVMGANAGNELMTLVGGGENTVGGSIGAPDYGWHLAALTVTGGNARLYENDAQIGVTFAAGSDVNTSVDWLIGSSRWDDNTGTGYPWKGKVDEPTVWNVALSEAEVAELFNAGTPMDPRTHSRAAGLIHWWRMGDGDTYPTITDRVGSANGTCTNMAGAGTNFTSDAP